MLVRAFGAFSLSLRVDVDGRDTNAVERRTSQFIIHVFCIGSVAVDSLSMK